MVVLLPTGQTLKQESLIKKEILVNLGQNKGSQFLKETQGYRHMKNSAVQMG